MPQPATCAGAPWVDDPSTLTTIKVDRAWQRADDRPMTDLLAPKGLKGVVVAETALGDVRGLEGFYHYRQYSATELAQKRSFEDVWHLLIDGELPDAAERAAFLAEVNPKRTLPEAMLDLLPVVASAHG